VRGFKCVRASGGAVYSRISFDLLRGAAVTFSALRRSLLGDHFYPDVDKPIGRKRVRGGGDGNELPRLLLATLSLDFRPSMRGGAGVLEQFTGSQT
jgi:hypothetical protein